VFRGFDSSTQPAPVGDRRVPAILSHPVRDASTSGLKPRTAVPIIGTMDASGQSWSARSSGSRQEGAGRLGEPVAPWRPASGATPRHPLGDAAPPLRYCSYCWATLTPGDVECRDCGQSVAEMRAQQATQAASDAAWVPNQLTPVRSSTISAATVRSSRRSRRRGVRRVGPELLLEDPQARRLLAWFGIGLIVSVLIYALAFMFGSPAGR
jgi:hypothetical protein